MLEVKVGDYLIKDDFIVGKVKYISDSKAVVFVNILHPQGQIDRITQYWFLSGVNIKLLPEKDCLFYELKYG
jgi:hypothetical protein